MAKTVYESKGNKLVDENIDETILRLLGLEDIYDLDYDEYKSLLKEAMTIGRMNSTKMASSETEKLTDEYKRIKRKEGRFKVKGKKVKTSSFVDEQTKSGSYTPTTRRLPATKSSQYRPKTSAQKMFGFSGDTVEDQGSVDESGQTVSPSGKISKGNPLASISESLTSIQNTLQSIISTLTNQEKSKDKAAESARKVAEKQKKRDREDASESKILGTAKKIGEKVVKPFQSFFDMILNFFKNILFGVIALKILEILKDPGKFFRDLVNPVVDFLNGIVKFIYSITVDPLNGLIDTLNTAMSGFVDLMNKIPLPGIEPVVYEPIPLIPKPLIPRLEPSEEEKPVTGMTGGGAVTNTTGEKISGMGADTQMVALQPGEVVMSKKAVDAYGANNLLAMNANAGGTNIPTQGSIPGFSGGGMVGFNPKDMMGSLTGMNQSAQSAFSSPSFRPPSLQQQSTTPQKPQLGKTPVKAKSKPSTAAVPASKPKPSSSGLTPQQKAFAETVAYAEGTAGNSGYNTWFGGSQYGGDLSRYTINQIVDLQKKFLAEGHGRFDGGRQKSAAVGKYQMIRPEIYAKAAGLNPSRDKFTPENQDKLFLYGYVMKQAGVTAAEIDSPTISDKTIDKLAPVFASFPNLFGPDKFGNYGTNTSFYGQGGKTKQAIKERYSTERNKWMTEGAMTPSSSPSSVAPSSPSSSVAPSSSPSFPDPTPSTSAPVVSPGSPRSVPGPRNKSGGTSVIPIPAGGGQQSPSSGSSGSQSAPSGFSPIDLSNPEILVVKSIYNIVG